MHKAKFTIIAALLLSGGPALAQETEQKRADPERKICKTVEDTASRIGRRRVCKTREEWQGETDRSIEGANLKTRH